MTHTTGITIGTELRAHLRGSVWQADDEGYHAARTVWNAAVDHRPGVIARCLDSDDVRTALLIAGEHGMPLSVRAGGHDWAGRALRARGLVLDLSAMRAARIDPGAAVVEAEGGAVVADLLDPAATHGLATPAPAVRSVGMAGMTMAGGYGGLIGRFGLALDNLLSADLVLADGRKVTASPDEEPELYWALRGGGGNFGVLTAARYRLHPLSQVLGGMVMYPLSQAGSVLRGYHELLATSPDELTVMAGFLTDPTGEPVVFLAPTWSGDLPAGEATVAALTRLGTPVMAGISPTAYPELLRMFEAGATSVNRYALGTRWLGELTDPAIDVLIEAAATCSSPLSLLALHQFHGAATRVAPEATAFALRRPHLLAEVIAAWPPGPAGADPAVAAAPHLEWIERTSSALAPGALPGGYPNILGPH